MNDSPTAFERFERRLFGRALLVFVGGGLALACLQAWLFQSPALGLLAVAGWLLASGVAASRLRQRHETAAAYKARIGYHDSPPNS